MEIFGLIDSDNSGGISLDEWISYCVGHIKDKIAAKGGVGRKRKKQTNQSEQSQKVHCPYEL